jgi:hypothetical protein
MRAELLLFLSPSSFFILYTFTSHSLAVIASFLLLGIREIK